MNSKKEPPDKYRCLKLPITSILIKDKEKEQEVNDNMVILQDAIIRTNAITTKTYFLLRLWVLNKYHNHQDIPEITEDTISMSMKSVLLPSSGPKPKGNNALLLQEFQQLHTFGLEDGSNLSATLDYYVTTMLTAIENNIKMRFFDYIKRFVNSYYKHLYQDQVENKDFKKQFYKEINLVKNDILNNTLTCDKKYHTWLQENRYKIVPETFETSYYYDIKVSPHKYLRHMIFMCLELEKLERKSFQFFPLQTNAIPRHIQLDTKAIVELFVDTEKHKKLLDIWIKNPKPIKTGKNKGQPQNKTKGCLYDFLEENKEFIWETFFSVKQKMKHYVFDYTIITDGYSTSLRFLHQNNVEEEQNKKKKKKAGKEAVKGLTQEEKEIIKEEKKQLQQEHAKQKRLESKKNSKKSKKEEKQENPEFPYIDEIPKEQLEGKHIFIDPGKRSLFSMMDDDGKHFSYTNRQYLKETKRLKYHSLLKNHKDNIGITKTEEDLNKYNSKSCNIDKFKAYITEKLKVNETLVPLYQEVKFRKYKWYAYINKKRAEDNMVNKIAKKYSKDHIIVIGDWSIGKQMRHFISTPNLTLKRKLQHQFKVYNIDEFRTSCLSYKTEEVCENLYLKFKKDTKQKERKIHSILTYKMENNRKGCINRDKNGCKNIQKVFNHYTETGERPEKYRRDYQIQTNKSPQTASLPEAVKLGQAQDFLI
jgi:N-acetylmuramoyl-L-alanine amidase